MDPCRAIHEGVGRTLQLAATWLSWDGTPQVSEEGDRIYTPHKAIRRYTDHLVDHLAQIEAQVMGRASLPDEWHGSLVTSDSDWARFTEVDLAEARQRLRRLEQIYVLRLEAVGSSGWDAAQGGEWTIRQIVEHVAPPWYAEQVGDLNVASSSRSGGAPGE